MKCAELPVVGVFRLGKLKLHGKKVMLNYWVITKEVFLGTKITDIKSLELTLKFCSNFVHCWQNSMILKDRARDLNHVKLV